MNATQTQLLDQRYASLARSKYSFGAGTASGAPSPERLAEIKSEMKELAAELAELRRDRFEGDYGYHLREDCPNTGNCLRHAIT